jgi:hypothetical protein
MAGIKYVDLTKPAAGQPIDLQGEQARLAQASAIAQALMQQGIMPQQASFATSPGNPYDIAVPNIGGPVGGVIDTIKAREQMEETLKRQTALEKLIQERTKGEVGGIMDLLRPGPPRMSAEETGGPGGPDVGGPAPMAPGRPPDFRGAVQAALSSTTPTAQALGKELQKGLITPQDMLQYGQHFSKEALDEYNRTGDPGVLTGRGKVTVEGGIATPTQDERVLPQTVVDKYGPVKELPEAPGVVASTSEVTGKPIFAPVQTVPGQREKEFTALDTKVLEKGRADYLANGGRMRTILQLQEDLKQIDEANFGTGATARNMVNKTLEALGGKKLDSTAGIETAAAELGRLMLGGELKQLYPVTDTDIRIMRGILGSEGMTKRSLERIMGVLQDSVANEMQLHTQFVKNVELPEKMSQEKFMERYAPSFTWTPKQTLPGVPEPPVGPRPATRETGPHPPSTNPYAGMSDEEFRNRPEIKKLLERIERQKQGR